MIAKVIDNSLYLYESRQKTSRIIRTLHQGDIIWLNGCTDTDEVCLSHFIRGYILTKASLLKFQYMKTRNATTPIYEEPNVESKKLGTYPENILLYVNPRPSPNGFMEIFGPDHTYGFIQKDDLLLYHPKNMFTTYEFTEKPHPIIAASYEEYTDLEKFKKLDLLISCAFALLFICCLFRFFQYWNEWSESQYILLVAILFSLIFLIIAIREVYFITAEMKAYQHIEEQFPHGSIGCEPFPSKLKNIGLNNN